MLAETNVLIRCKQGMSWGGMDPLRQGGLNLKIALLMSGANSETGRGQKNDPVSTAQDANR